VNDALAKSKAELLIKQQALINTKKTIEDLRKKQAADAAAANAKVAEAAAAKKKADEEAARFAAAK